jgi:hypothetical protein
MPITLQCSCGTQFKVLDDLAGKKVRCPGCQQAVAVLGAFTATVQPVVKPRFDDIEDEPVPFKKKKKRPVRSGFYLGLWLALGGGALVLVCCCAGAGVIGFLVLLNQPERALYGKWAGDPAQPFLGFGGFIEFRSNGTVTDTSPLTPIIEGKWKTLSSPGADIIRVQVTAHNGFGVSTLDVRVVDEDHIRVRVVGSNIEVPLKRIN